MNANSHLLLVVNPKSGSSDKTELIESLTTTITAQGHTYELYETTGDHDADAILKSIKSKATERIIIAGGDGTINLVAHALKDHSIPYGIIPSGSANGLASNLDLPDDLQAQIDVALGDHLIEMDHLNVNGHSSLHIADLGLNAELIHNFEDSSIRGKLGYLLQTIPTLIKTEGPFVFEIEIDGQKIERTGILLAIANANQYGSGATINPNGSINDGKFEILVFKELNTLEILRTIYDKVDFTNDFAECFSLENVVITTQEPVPFQIDGEPMGKTQKVEVSIYPKKIHLFVPSTFKA